MGINQKCSVFLLVTIQLSLVLADDGSKCPGTNCSPAPSGMTCEAKYDRDDGCCPEWNCPNGQTVYGMSKSSSSGSSYSSSSSSSFGNAPGGNYGGMPPMRPMPMLPGFGGANFPFFG